MLVLDISLNACTREWERGNKAEDGKFVLVRRIITLKKGKASDEDEGKKEIKSVNDAIIGSLYSIRFLLLLIAVNNNLIE